MRALLLVALGWLAAVPDEADDQYAYVAGLAEKGLYDRVVKEAESFLREHPDHAKAAHARYRLACALFELTREPEAAEHFRELARRRAFEFEPEVQFRLGQCELAADRCEPAATALARAAALAADGKAAKKEYLLVPATALLAEAHFRCERWDAAEASWTALLERAPESEYASDAACGLAWCAYRTNERDEAIERITRWLASRRDDPRAGEMRFVLGECHLDAGRPKEALAAYRAVRSGPYAEAALRGAGFALAAQGDHAGAAREFTTLVETYPESRFQAECTLHGGIERLLAGDAAGARALLESKPAGEGAQTLYWRARAQAGSGAAEAALATLDRALGAKPDEKLAAEIEIARGDVLAKLGRAEDAARAWERSGSDYALQAAAIASLHSKRYADTIRFSEKLLADHPESKYRVEAGLALGEARFAGQAYAEAEQALEAALGADPDAARRVRTRVRIAWCRYLADDVAGAAELFGTIAREAPGAPEAEEALFMHARSLEALGDKPTAARSYGAYLERFDDGAHADEALLRLVRLDPRIEATDLLADLLREQPDSSVADEVRFELAERLSAAQRWLEAGRRYAELLEAHPESPLVPAARYGLAWSEFQQGRTAEAAAALAPLVAAPGTPPELVVGALELLVSVHAKGGSPTELVAVWQRLNAATRDEPRLLRAARTAIAALEKAGRAGDAAPVLAALAKLVRDPEVSSAIAVERAYLLLGAGKLDDAERELAGAARAAPAAVSVAEAYFHAGEARFAAGEDARASALYAVAAQNASSPVADRALYKDGFARLRRGDVEGAERSFAALVEKHPQSELLHETLFLLGEAQFRRERFDLAVASLRRVVQEAPRHAVRPKALFRLGLAYGRSEQWSESAETLATLMRETPAFPNAPEAELARGRALARLGRAREARAALERVTANDRGDLSAHARLELGRLHEAAGEHDPALSEFLKVAVLYAEPEIVAEALLEAGMVLEAQGDAARAREQYEEIVEKHPKAKAATPARERLRVLAQR